MRRPEAKKKCWISTRYKLTYFKMELWNFKGKQNTITEALQLYIPERAVISITGSGGKTSLMFAWARELSAAGRSVAVTTTTHMGAGQTAPDEEGIAMYVSPDPDRPGKVMAPPAEVMEELYETADVVLIEADGSRLMPLKWPAPWEPAVPERTDITVCVAGLSALGRPLSDVMYRADELPEGFIRAAANRTSAKQRCRNSVFVDEELIAAVLSSPEGGRKGEQGEFRVFLNQADTEELRASASRIQMLLAVRGIQSAWGTLL